MTLGNAYENAHAESLNKAFKLQEINIAEYQNIAKAAQSIFDFKQIYNELRPHSTLGMIMPTVFMKKYATKFWPPIRNQVRYF